MKVLALVIFVLIVAVMGAVTGRNVVNGARGQTPLGRATVDVFRKIPGLRRTVREPYRSNPPWEQPPEK